MTPYSSTQSKANSAAVSESKGNGVILQGLCIASPCSANWNGMAGDSCVRHCSECDRKVYNLSEMSARDAEQLILAHEGRLCVRFYRRSDGTILTRDCPVGLVAAMRRLSKVASMVLSALMTVSFAAGQSAARTNSQSLVQKQRGSATVSLTIVDSQGLAIREAKVALKNKTTGKIRRGVTDSSGFVNISGFAGGKYSLAITSSYHHPYFRSIDISDVGLTTLKIKLKDTTPFTDLMGAVFVQLPEPQPPKINLGGEGSSEIPPAVYQPSSNNRQK